MLAREVLRAAHLADRLDSLRPDAGLLHGALPFARRGAAGSDKGCRALALGRAVTSEEVASDLQLADMLLGDQRRVPPR